MHKLFLILEQLQFCFNAKTDNMSTVQTVHIGRQPCRPDRQTDTCMRRCWAAWGCQARTSAPKVLKPVFCSWCKHGAGRCSSARLVTVIQSWKKPLLAGGWRSRGVWSEANIQASGELNLAAGWYEGKESLNCRLNINTQTTQSHFAPHPTPEHDFNKWLNIICCVALNGWMPLCSHTCFQWWLMTWYFDTGVLEQGVIYINTEWMWTLVEKGSAPPFFCCWKLCMLYGLHCCYSVTVLYNVKPPLIAKLLQVVWIICIKLPFDHAKEAVQRFDFPADGSGPLFANFFWLAAIMTKWDRVQFSPVFIIYFQSH